MDKDQNMEEKKLTDDELKQVSGGFKQDIPEAYSFEEIIICPSCGNGNQGHFLCEAYPDLQKDLYTCTDCGQQFFAASGEGITDIL